MPDGTFQLTIVANPALSMVRNGTLSLSYHINVTFFCPSKIFALVSLKVPSGAWTVFDLYSTVLGVAWASR